MRGGNDGVLLARSKKREYSRRNFLPPVFHDREYVAKNRCDPDFARVFFSRENRFLYLIDGTFSCAHRETHCRHVARLAEKRRVSPLEKAIVYLPFFLSIFHRCDRASERAIEFREINLDVAEIHRGPVEWKMDYVAMFGSYQYFLLLIFSKQGICTLSRDIFARLPPRSFRISKIGRAFEDRWISPDDLRSIM